MQSKAKTIEQYLDELPDDRRHAIEKVRAVILKNLPKGYKESMQYGMICYIVPLSTYPKGYLDNPTIPVGYVALASQKNYMSLYLYNYMDKGIEAWFKKAYKASGKKLDMGKSCLIFKKIEDLALDVIGSTIAKTSVANYIKMYERGRIKKK